LPVVPIEGSVDLIADRAVMSIVAIELTQNHRTLNTFYHAFGGGWRSGGGFGNATTTVDTYKVGTLIVDLFAQRLRR